MSSNQAPKKLQNIQSHNRDRVDNFGPEPYPKDVRRLTSIQHLIPPKRATDGSWKHTLYVPAWTDPDWEDSGVKRENSDWPIGDGLANKVRPALLAKDKILNPTKYAERFGVFCGRTDGRSRTSPTRAESRQLFSSGDVRTGKDLFDRLQGLAASRGRDLEDFMAEERIDMQNLSASDEMYVKKYEELIIDEFWQGLLFGDLTMDEMHAEKYFTMGEAKCDLTGPLHPLFTRDKWLDTRKRGNTVDKARLVYSINGERGEYDPRTNDRLWEAMQPALQLATRFVESKDPYITALQDFSNRFYVDPSLDTRKADQKKLYPRISFRRYVDLDDPLLLPEAKNLQESESFTPSEYSWKALLKTLQFVFVSAHYSDAPTFTYPGPSGETCFGDLAKPDSPIFIAISAELAWPLLVDNYSTSEKLVASYILATTIAHEIMHAWIIAHCKFLHNPAAWGIQDSFIGHFCQNLCKELYPKQGYEYAPEPHFEDDPLAEAGHAFENHVIGGGAWPLCSTMNYRIRMPFLGEFAGIAIQSKWPDGTMSDLGRLSSPGIRVDAYSHFMRIEDVEKVFRQNFWQASVARYGMAAVRDASRKPHKVIFAAEDSRYNLKYIPEMRQFNEKEQQRITEYFDFLLHSDQRTLLTYLRSLVMEAYQFDLMGKRFQQDLSTWKEYAKKRSDSFRVVFLMIVEYYCNRTLLTGLTKEKKNEIINKQHEDWTGISNMCGNLLDDVSRICKENFRKGVLSISISEHCNRIVRGMMDLVKILESERLAQESMLCELYQLPTKFWSFYKMRMGTHYKHWKRESKLIIKEIAALGRTAGKMNEPYLSVWKNEWKPRFQSLGTAFKNISRLLELNEDAVNDGWRDLLRTVPMLRKCRRKPHERKFFLAKKEMLKATGGDLESLEAFKSLLEKRISLESWKIVLPETSVDEQGLAQRWAGLLDDILEKKRSGPALTGVFSTDPVKRLVRRLERQERDAEESMLRQAAGSERSESKSAKPVVPTLQRQAEAEAMRAPSIAPKITEPFVNDQGLSFSAPRSSRFGRVSELTGTPPELARRNSLVGAFLTYVSEPHGFPPQKPGRRPSWTPTEVAKQVNAPGKMPTRRKSAFGIMPHPYAIRETISRDLLNVVEKPAEYTPSITFSSEKPRVKKWTMGQPGKQGEGSLGDIDDAWEQQLREEMLAYEVESSQPDDDQGAAEGSAFVARAIGGIRSRSTGGGLQEGGSSRFTKERERGIKRSAVFNDWDARRPDAKRRRFQD